MFFKKLFLFSFVLAAFSAVADTETQLCTNAPERIVVASWNVENLFDAYDDPDNKGDDEYTPSGWTRWTEARYRLKLTNLAEIVTLMHPSVINLVEVENRRVLEDLSEVLSNSCHYSMPYIVHRDSSDPRGIDVAMLSKFAPVKFSEIRSVKGLRESPMATFKIHGRELIVIGNHWKSRAGEKKISDAKREVMADAVRKKYLDVLTKKPTAAIVVCGDFNDDIDDSVPMISGGFSTNILEVQNGGTKLFNLQATLPPDKRGTYFYSQTKTWNSFDMMCVSRGMLSDGESAWKVVPDSFKVFATEKQRMGEDGAPYPFRRVGTKNGHKIYNGYADHFPILVELEAR